MYNGQGQSGYANQSREVMKLAQKLRDIGHVKKISTDVVSILISTSVHSHHLIFHALQLLEGSQQGKG